MSAMLERFIPVTLEELVDDLCNLQVQDRQLQAGFILLSRAYITLFHAQFHQQVHTLQAGYAPFNPDRDTISQPQGKLPQDHSFQHDLISAVKQSLVRANFIPLPEEIITKALAKTSPHGVEVSVDFGDFEEMILYYRSSNFISSERRHWRTAYLRKEMIEIPVYRRLFLLLKPKPFSLRAVEIARQENISLEKALRKVHKSRAMLADIGEDSNIYIKLFKDIPHSDLEMLFPNTHVRMCMFDKVNLTLTGGGGTIGGVMATLSKLGAAANPVTAATAIAGLAGVIWRQITKVFAQRTKYMATLARHLYFYSLDNNAGALAHLVELAEAEECKEALLAYYFLLTEAHRQFTDVMLDQRIEAYLDASYHQEMDFEISDGLRKLEQAGLLLRSPEGVLSVLEPNAGLVLLEKAWKDIFPAY